MDETIQGQKTFTLTPASAAEGADGTGSQPLATRAYVHSRSENLITNGAGSLLNNYNFPGLTAVPCEGFPRVFRTGTTLSSTQCTELIQIDPNATYRLSAYVRNGDADGSFYVANSRFYYGIACHDGDGLAILPSMYTRYPGAADTTLAAPLAPGDTTVTLTSATGWGVGAASTRQFTWWPYVSAEGCVFSPYTYSRNTTNNSTSYTSAGAYTATIVGNVLTLTSAWPTAFGTLPAGTPIRNSQLGGVYQYCTASNKISPNTWTRYDGKIAGLNTDGLVNDNNRFPMGTTYIHPVLLHNYTTPGAHWYFGNLTLNQDIHFNIGEHKSYTPEWRASVTQPVLGNGAILAKYAVVGQMMFIDIDLRIGSTTNIGSGEYSFSPPAGYTYDNTTPLTLGIVSVLDDSAVEYWSGWAYYGAPTPLGIYMRTPSSTPMQGDRPVGTTYPITPDVGDRYRVSVRLKLTGVFA